jgi:hypothetical protein
MWLVQKYSAKDIYDSRYKNASHRDRLLYSQCHVIDGATVFQEDGMGGHYFHLKSDEYDPAG